MISSAHFFASQIPTLASCAFDDLVSAAAPGQVQFLQLCVEAYTRVSCSHILTVLLSFGRYVNKDRKVTQKFVQHAEERGIKALFITVDAPQLGRREKVRLLTDIPTSTLKNALLLQDMRMKFEAEDPDEVTKAGENVDRSQGAAKAITV